MSVCQIILFYHAHVTIIWSSWNFHRTFISWNALGNYIFRSKDQKPQSYFSLSFCHVHPWFSVYLVDSLHIWQKHNQWGNDVPHTIRRSNVTVTQVILSFCHLLPFSRTKWGSSYQNPRYTCFLYQDIFNLSVVLTKRLGHFQKLVKLPKVSSLSQ